MLGNQVAGPVERRAVHPSCPEAERVELRPQHVGDPAHAGNVQRAAIDIDDLLEKRQRLAIVCIDGADQSAFACTESGRRLRHDRGGQRGDGGDERELGVRKSAWAGIYQRTGGPV